MEERMGDRRVEGTRANGLGVSLGVLLVLALGACGDTSADRRSPSDAASPGDVAPDGGQVEALRIVQPGAFELVEPGATLEVLVDSGGLAAEELELRIGAGAPIALEASATPGWLRATVKVDGAVGNARLLSVRAKNAPARLPALTRLQLARAQQSRQAQLGAGALELALGELTLTFPAGALAAPGSATVSRFSKEALPRLEHEELVGGLHKLHLSQDPEQISAAVGLRFTLDAAQTAALTAAAAEQRQLALVVVDGPDGDPHAPGVASYPMRVEQAKDASAALVAELPPEAFHRSGSSTALFYFRVERLPLALERFEVCERNALGSVLRCAGATAPRRPSLRLTGQPNHSVSVEARYRWTRTPPNWRLPLASYSELTSPFNPRRKLPGRSARKHAGVDLRAPVGTPLIATFDGRATAVLLNPATGLISVILRSSDGAWVSRYLHLSALDGYTSRRRMNAGDRLGRRIKPAYQQLDFDYIHSIYWINDEPALAPVDGVYTLRCRSHPIVQSSRERGYCSVSTTTADGTVHTVEKLIAVERDLFRRQVRQGDVLGQSGKTATNAPHLHYETIAVKDGRWRFFDPALIHQQIADDGRAHNGPGSGPRSPAMRIGLGLTDVASGVERLLGVDPQSRVPSAAAPCIDGGQLVDPLPIELAGPSGPTERSWDLGQCLYNALCTGPATTTRLGVGALTFYEPESGPRRWRLLGGLLSRDSLEISCCPDCEDWDYTLTDSRASTFADGSSSSKQDRWHTTFTITASGWRATQVVTGQSSATPAPGSPSLPSSTTGVQTKTYVYDGNARTLTVTASIVTTTGGSSTTVGPTTTVQPCPSSTSCPRLKNPGGTPLSPTLPECRGDPPTLVAWDGGNYSWSSSWADATGSHSNSGSVSCIGCIGRSTHGCSCTASGAQCN
jgi:murein DD-endopeptidase MepM/ murein hydrolase activator NlpD